MNKRRFLTILFGIVGFVLLSRTGYAAYCLVSTEDSNPFNIVSLAYKVQEKYNIDSACDNPDGSYDEDLFFAQTIRFATDEAGYPDNDINEIVISRSSRIITFNNRNFNIAVGNFPLVLPPDDDFDYNYRPEYDADPTRGLIRDDYGIVIIDGTALPAGERPIKCAALTKPVILRNLIIETNGITRSGFFNRSSTAGKCFKDGGAVYICTGQVDERYMDDPLSDPDANCDNGFVPRPDEICDNGEDDDGDGLEDCSDPDCNSNPACIETNCTDGVDDDGDGDIDCDDGNCASDPACFDEPDPVEICDNDADDDGDGIVDCDDPDCSADAACIETNCTNSVDDDGDGNVDCDDPDCIGTEDCPDVAGETTGCAEGTNCCDDYFTGSEEPIDNDRDGLANCADPDCADNEACVEAAAETVCNDDVDNDEDGDIDCDDADCFGDPACGEPPEVCDNEADDDGDTLTDCNDPDCEEDPACDADGDDDDDDGDVDNDRDGYTVNEGDCDDNNITIHPGATEACDGADNDCDDEVDETCAGDPEEDNDGDGYCEDADEDGICADGSAPGDCDDSSVDINPDAVELCDDAIDNNCDGLEGITDPSISVPSPVDDTEGETTAITIGGDSDDDGSEVPPGEIPPETEEDLNEAGFTLNCEITPDDGSGGDDGGGCGCDLTGSVKPIRSQMPFILFVVLIAMFGVWKRLSLRSAKGGEAIQLKQLDRHASFHSARDDKRDSIKTLPYL